MDTLNLLTQQLFSRTQNFRPAAFDSRTDTSYGTDTFDALMRRKSDGTVSFSDNSADTSAAAGTVSGDNTVEFGADNRDNSRVTDNTAWKKPEHAEKIEEPDVPTADNDEDDNLALAAGLTQTARPEIQYVDSFGNTASDEPVPEVSMAASLSAESGVTENVSLPEIPSDIGKSLESGALDTAGSFTVISESVITESTVTQESQISSEEPALLNTAQHTQLTDYIRERPVATGNGGDSEENSFAPVGDSSNAEDIGGTIRDVKSGTENTSPLKNTGAAPDENVETLRGDVNAKADSTVEHLANKLDASVKVVNVKGTAPNAVNNDTNNQQPAVTEEPEQRISAFADRGSLVYTVGRTYEMRPEIQYVDSFDDIVPTEDAPEVSFDITDGTILTQSAPETVEAFAGTVAADGAEVLPAETDNTAVKSGEFTGTDEELLTEEVDYASETTAAADTDNSTNEDNTLADDDDEKSDKLLQDENKDVGTSAPVFENEKATPVKVAEPVRETVNMEAEDAIEQLADKLGISVEADYNKVEITLSPASLGKLTVEISKTENGVISIVMHTTNAKAAALLERGTSNLQNIIATNTGADVKVEVQKSDGTENQYLNPNDQQNSGRQGQQEQQKKRKQSDTMDFMQKLRLGLVGLDSVAV